MADIVKFVSAAAGTKRVVLIGDDSDGSMTVKTIDALDATQNSVVLTQDLRKRLCSAWINGEEAFLMFDVGDQFFCVMALDKSSVWSAGNGTDEDTPTDEVQLDQEQTSILVGWVKAGQPISLA